MESLILGSMAYTGNKINKNKNKSKKKSAKKIDVYDTNISGKINKATINQAKQVNETGYATQFDAIMIDNFESVPVGLNQSSSSMNGHDMSLQRDLDFGNGYSEFSKTQMHYDVVPKNDIMTSNMMPNSGKREFTTNKDYSHVLGLHTGNDELHMSKENFTPVSLFEPMKNLTYVNGAPVFTDLLEERYIPSYKNNMGDLPFKNKLKVTPGLKGQEQGANSGNAVYRILPKTIDELRGNNNPKIIYKADKIESGKKGHKPAIDHNLTKYKRSIHKKRDEELPNYNSVEKHIKAGKYRNPNTNRSTSRSDYGHLHNSTQGHVQKGKHEDSYKVTYQDDSISRAISNVNNKPVLQNSGAFSNNENERSSTNHNITGSVYNNNEGSYVIDNKDIPLTTLRQLMINGDTNIGVTNNNNGNSYVFSNDLVLPANNRTVTGTLTTEGNINPTEKFGNVNPTDRARSTIGETTTMKSVQGNVAPEGHKSYTNNKDNAKHTIRQTTEYNNYSSNLKPDYHGMNLNNPDNARQTIGETTSSMVVSGSLKADYHGMNLNNPDNARQTIGETTTHMTKEGFMNPDYHGMNLNNPDNARQTIGETTSSMTVTAPIKSDCYGHTLNYTDIAKHTVGETTSSMTVSGPINPDFHGHALNYTDNARHTVGETTSSMTVVGSLNPTHKETHYYNPNDVTKRTVKETTSLSKYISNTLNAEGGNNYVRNNDIAKQTVKQTTLGPDEQANIRSNNANIVRSNDSKATQTVKQTTLYSTGENNLHTGTATYAKDYKDMAKGTIKETTLHATQGGRTGRSTIGYSRDKSDKARTTIKQTTIDNVYTGPLEGPVNKHESQQAARNVCIDDRREILTYNRPAGPKSDKIGPVINKNTVKLKEENFLKRQNVGFVDRNCDKLVKTFTRNKNNLSTAGYAINDDFINTFKDNPLANALNHQKN